MSKKVFLGVGHGGADSGACGNGLKEKDINLTIALSCKEELQRHGVEVAISRTKDEDDPVNEEVKECNAFEPDIAIDVHTNAGGGDGFECFYSVVGGLGKTLSENIEKEVLAIGQNSRGLKTRASSNGVDYYAFIRDTKCHAIITECAFIDNVNDVQIINTIEKQKLFGIAYAKGILKTLSIPYINKQDTIQIPLTTEQFIIKIKDISISESKRINILPSLTIAQAILESDKGNSELAVKANALFGIKATDWTGEKYSKTTKEIINGKEVEIVAEFRAYKNWDGSIIDHSNFLLKDRYKLVIGETDYKKACYELYNAGYATDIKYPEKLIKVIEDNKLYQYDTISNNTQQVPEYKINGEKYLRDMLYITSKHDPLEIIDFGTLGIILMNYDKVHNVMKI